MVAAGVVFIVKIRPLMNTRAFQSCVEISATIASRIAPI